VLRIVSQSVLSIVSLILCYPLSLPACSNHYDCQSVLAIVFVGLGNPDSISSGEIMRTESDAMKEIVSITEKKIVTSHCILRNENIITKVFMWIWL